MDRAAKERKMISLMVNDLGIADTDEQEMTKMNEEVGALSEEELDKTLAGRLDLPYPVDEEVLERALTRVEEPGTSLGRLYRGAGHEPRGATRRAGGLGGRFLRVHGGGRDLRFQRVHLAVKMSQGVAGFCHAGVLRADKAGVGRYRLSHPLGRAGKLRLELPGDYFPKTIPQSVGFFPKLLAGLTPPVRDDKEPQARQEQRRKRHGYVYRRGHRDRRDRGPEPQSADLGGDGLGDGALLGRGLSVRIRVRGRSCGPRRWRFCRRSG